MASRRRGALAALAFVGVVFSSASCAATFAGPSVTVEREERASWSVEVEDPRFSGEEMCGSDAAVEQAALSLDLPSSGYGIILRADATEEDAMRIAGCLESALAGGHITVAGPLPG